MPENIHQQIEYTRQKMIQSGIENGLLSSKTILLSKQVDQLMNTLDKFQYNGMPADYHKSTMFLYMEN